MFKYSKAYLIRNKLLDVSNKHSIEIMGESLGSMRRKRKDEYYNYITKNNFLGFNNEERKFKPLIIVGPSGVGKGTLIKGVLRDFKNYIRESISHTTRYIRVGEKDGVNYHFVSRREFEELIGEGSMLEYREIYGNYYGTSKLEMDIITKEEKICLLEIDIEGALKMKKCKIEGNYIFIYPPSLETLNTRLIERGTEDEETIRVRNQHAINEINLANNSLLFQYKIMNDDLNISDLELNHLVQALYHIPSL